MKANKTAHIRWTNNLPPPPQPHKKALAPQLKTMLQKVDNFDASNTDQYKMVRILCKIENFIYVNFFCSDIIRTCNSLKLTGQYLSCWEVSRIFPRGGCRPGSFSTWPNRMGQLCFLRSTDITD